MQSYVENNVPNGHKITANRRKVNELEKAYLCISITFYVFDFFAGYRICGSQ